VHSSIRSALVRAVCEERLAPRSEVAHFHAVPWSWWHQYDLKLQTVGLSRGYDQIAMRGDAKRRGFSVVYLRQERVIDFVFRWGEAARLLSAS